MKASHPNIIQVVSSQWCSRCDVCCRFPEKDSFLAPYFTSNEIMSAVSAGLDKSHFSCMSACKITLTPFREGYICPAFDPESAHCKIYDVRPLDCIIYPFAIMWSADGKDIVIGMDMKCPYVAEFINSDRLREAAIEMRSTIDSSPLIDIISENPGLIGPHQDDVTSTVVLTNITKALAYSRKINMDLSAYGLTPLEIKHKPLLDGILNRQNTMLSAYSFTAHYIWRDHFDFHWGIIDSYLCLFAQYDNYIYMPVPPVPSENVFRCPSPLRGEGKGEGLSSPFLPREGIQAVFNIMDKININKTVSRIENIDEAWIEYFTSAGYKIKPGESEFVYLREDLANLKGDPYKSKRAMCNYFEKHYSYSYEPFGTGHAAHCIELYSLWKHEKIKKVSDPFYNATLEDSFMTHREVINNHESPGITGRVVKIDDRVEGYIFGFERNKDIFCILLEIANPAIKGLAQFIFREFCKEMEGYTYINALGDSGLKNLRNVKLSYRPERLVPSFIATGISTFSFSLRQAS